MLTPTVCAQPGCPEVAMRYGRCAEHALAERRRRHESTRAWRQLRQQVLDRAQSVCERCGEEAATDAHHLVARARGWTRHLGQPRRGLRGLPPGAAPSGLVRSLLLGLLLALLLALNEAADQLAPTRPDWGGTLGQHLAHALVDEAWQPCPMGSKTPRAGG
jgi:hypothetical protein